jgi:hypothetical protein
MMRQFKLDIAKELESLHLIVCWNTNLGEK